MPSIALSSSATAYTARSSSQQIFSDALTGQLIAPLAAKPFETSEHVKVVDTTSGNPQTVSVNGVTITDGELSALPDFVATPEKLLKMKQQDLQDLVDSVRRQTAEPGSVDTEQWNKLTKDEYIKVLRDNASHFSVGDFASLPNNKSSYETLHAKALKLAQKGDIKNLAKARVYEGYAVHFLADAMSAGHLINKNEVMDKFSSAMKLADNKENFLSTLAKAVWNADGVSRQFEGYKLKLLFKMFLGTSKISNEEEFKKILYGMCRGPAAAIFPNLAVKSVHDALGKAGVEVENELGETWTTAGDGALISNKKTWDQAQKAINASYQELDTAKNGAAILPREYKAWTFVPRPTRGGKAFIDQKVAEYTDPQSRILHEEAIATITAQIPVMITAMVKYGVISKAKESKSSS